MKSLCWFHKMIMLCRTQIVMFLVWKPVPAFN